MNGTYTRSTRIQETGTIIKTSNGYQRRLLVLLLSNGGGSSIGYVAVPDSYIVKVIDSLNGIDVHHEIYQKRREFSGREGVIFLIYKDVEKKG